MPKTFFNKETLIWSGEPAAPASTEINLGQALLNALKKPEKIVQINDNNGFQMTNLEIYQKSIAVAKNLKKLGYNQSTVIGIYSKNNHYLSSIIFGCIINGVPVNPIDPTYRREEIVHMFRLTKPSVVFCENDNVNELKIALNILSVDIPIYVFHEKIAGCLMAEDLFNGVTDDAENFEVSAVKDPEKEICVIICSSGTTGLSKGVSLSYASFLNTNLIITTPKTISLCYSSLYWLSGFSTLLNGTLYECVRIITTEPFSAELALKMIPKYKVNNIVGPPSNLAMILNHPTIKTTDLSTITHYWSGGSIVYDELIVKMNKYLQNGQVYVGYGMSEGNAATAMSLPDPHLGSVGQIGDGIQVKIVDDDGNKCDVMIDGEICFYTKYHFLGYYGNEEETKKVFDSDGFLCTGDIGHFDENGYLYVVDRKKDIIKYKNSQISPSELESVIQKHVGVELVCVVGIPDLICIDLPAVAIVKSGRGGGSDDTLLEDDINKMIKESFSDAKQLRGGIYFMDSFPLTPSGKILRRKIKDIVVELYKQRQILKQ